MPTPYVIKVAKKHHKSVEQGEKTWERAKHIAAGEGKKDNFAYIMGIFQRLMKEK